MSNSAKLNLPDGQSIDLPVLTGSENEKAIDMETKNTIIDLDKKFLRPTEVDYLKGDFSKARKKLKWKPTITTNELIEDMIEEEISK